MWNGAFRDDNSSMHLMVNGSKRLLRLQSVFDVDHALATLVWAHRNHPDDVSYHFYRSTANILLDRRNEIAPKGGTVV